MDDIEKVIKGLETCIPMKYETSEDKECRHEQCPYGRENHKTTDGCIWDLMHDALELLKEYKRQDECPCTHCMEWECDEVCDEYKKWKDT